MLIEKRERNFIYKAIRNSFKENLSTWTETYTSRIRSPFLIPACSAAPLSKTALTCCKGAYNSPLILRSCPPSLTWPRTLKPNPVSVLFIVTTRGPFATFMLSTLITPLTASESAAIFCAWQLFAHQSVNIDNFPSFFYPPIRMHIIYRAR